MKTNEFRIGNYLEYENEIVSINDLTERLIGFEKNGFCYLIPTNQLKPIRITEEILIKCERANTTFSNVIFAGMIYVGDKFLLCPTRTPLKRYVASLSNDISEEEYPGLLTMYLHQLQNLYYALYKKELKIKL